MLLGTWRSTRAHPQQGSTLGTMKETHTTYVQHPLLEPPAASTPTVTPAPVLLVWDSPNMDMTLSNLLGGQKPGKSDRPDMSKLAEWVHHRAVAAGTSARAVLAMNVQRDTPREAPVAKFIQVVRQMGFEVFVLPKDTPTSDVDDAIVHLAGSTNASEIIVATHDSPLLARIRKVTSSPMAVLGFSEALPCYRRTDLDAAFIDVAEVPGLVPATFQRLATPSFSTLPTEGLLLAPLGPLFRVPVAA